MYRSWRGSARATTVQAREARWGSPQPRLWAAIRPADRLDSDGRSLEGAATSSRIGRAATASWPASRREQLARAPHLARVHDRVVEHQADGAAGADRVRQPGGELGSFQPHALPVREPVEVHGELRQPRHAERLRARLT